MPPCSFSKHALAYSAVAVVVVAVVVVAGQSCRCALNNSTTKTRVAFADFTIGCNVCSLMCFDALGRIINFVTAAAAVVLLLSMAANVTTGVTAACF